MRMVKKHELSEPKTRLRRDADPARPEGREKREAKKRQAVNVYVNRETLKVAREMKINLSQVLERELDKLTAKERADQFYRENKEWIDAHNAYVEKHGTLTMQLLGPDAFDDPSA